MIRAVLGALPAPAAEESYRQIQGFCRWLGAPEERQTVRARHGAWMSLDLSDRTQRIIFYHAFEAGLLPCLKRVLPVGGVFLDAGANVGYYTLWAGGRVGPSGQVYAFEPVPSTFERLRENVRLNRLENVTVTRAALGLHTGPCVLATDAIDSGLSHIASSSETGVEAPAYRLDDWLDKSEADRRTPDVLKMDVEGFETVVLRGARRLLSGPNPPALLVEVDDRMLRRQGSSEEELFDLLESLGYAAFDIAASGRVRPLPSPQGPRIRHGHNLLFLHGARSSG